jgi:hypothetical protein
MNKVCISSTLAAIVFGVLLIFALVTDGVRTQNMLIGVTAQCRDGMFTATPRGSGICSGHGGVKKYIEKGIKQ